jgi:hypothetical protein
MGAPLAKNLEYAEENLTHHRRSEMGVTCEGSERKRGSPRLQNRPHRSLLLRDEHARPYDRIASRSVEVAFKLAGLAGEVLSGGIRTSIF